MHFVRRIVHIIFWPSSTVKNDRVRHILYAYVIIGNSYTAYMAYKACKDNAEEMVDPLTKLATDLERWQEPIA